MKWLLTYSPVHGDDAAHPFPMTLTCVHSHLELVSETGNETDDAMGFEGSVDGDAVRWKHHGEILELIHIRLVRIAFDPCDHRRGDSSRNFKYINFGGP